MHVHMPSVHYRLSMNQVDETVQYTITGDRHKIHVLYAMSDKGMREVTLSFNMHLNLNVANVTMHV